MEYIKAENLTFKYKKTDEAGHEIYHEAIKGVSFSIEKGSFVAIIGQNGSGKSTLAKNMNALLIPTTGKMYVDGIDTSDLTRLWDVRQRVAMVFQNPDNQIVSAIVEDDVAFGPENIGVDPAEIRRRVDAALSGVEMSDYKKKAPHLLSGGQKQRIAIAGAVAMEPECIVFDEPTAMLDPAGREEVLSVIKKLNARGITTVLITHFMEEAAEADYVLVMDNGEIKMSGTPEEIFRNVQKLKDLSLDVPTSVALTAALREKGIDIPEDLLTADQLVEALTKEV